ncbi:MAG: HYC_CC_PP family protein [Ferruginibacter sp.]
MKKVLLSVFTLFYLLVSTGFTVDLHYCMGHFVGVDFHNNENEACDRCGMTEKNNGCCHDETAYFKLPQGHTTLTQFHTPAFSADVIMPTIQQWPASINWPIISTHVFRLIDLPPPDGPPLFILHGVFLI